MWVLGTEPESSARANGWFLTAESSLQTHAAGTFYDGEQMNVYVAKVRSRERMGGVHRKDA